MQLQVRHHCHALRCAVETRPEMLMCLAHWVMVPRELQRRVKATYRRGQCDDKRPSRAWIVAAHRAATAVAARERSLSPELLERRAAWADEIEAAMRGRDGRIRADRQQEKTI